MVCRSEPRNKPKKQQRQKYQIQMLEKAELLWTNGALMLRRVDVNSQKTAMRPLFLSYTEMSSKMDQKYAKAEI